MGWVTNPSELPFGESWFAVISGKVAEEDVSS